MKYLFAFALFCFATPAFALSDFTIEYCLTTTNPKACIQTARNDDAQLERTRQREAIEAQLEMARIQANGLALFGSGAAMMNGVSQGFNNMRLPPVITPQIYPVPQR